MGSWIKVLQEDPLEIFRAAADAEKIQEFVLGFEQKQVQEQTTQQKISTQEETMQLAPTEAAQSLSIAASAELEQQPAAQLMTRNEFAQVAKAVPLENHGRRWEVFFGERSMGFSDADTAAGAVIVNVAL